MATSKRTQNILITGASSGIGEALALQYAKTSAQKLYLSGRNQERLQDVQRRCIDLGAECEIKIIDVTNKKDMSEWITECENKSPLNIVIANAGIGTINEDDESIYKTFDTNLYGVLHTILPTISLFKKRQESNNNKKIVIISSMAGYHGLYTCPSYSASKAAVKAYGEALRIRLKPEGIDVNVVCPGFVRSRITDQNTCPMPFFMEAPDAAKIIVQGIEQNKGIIAFPAPMHFIVWFGSILPNWLSDFIYSKLPYKA